MTVKYTDGVIVECSFDSITQLTILGCMTASGLIKIARHVPMYQVYQLMDTPVLNLKCELCDKGQGWFFERLL